MERMVFPKGAMGSVMGKYAKGQKIEGGVTATAGKGQDLRGAKTGGPKAANPYKGK